MEASAFAFARRLRAARFTISDRDHNAQAGGSLICAGRFFRAPKAPLSAAG